MTELLARGKAQIKNDTIKYKGNGEFELTLTGVTSVTGSDNLLALNGHCFSYGFYDLDSQPPKELKETGTLRMFNSAGGVVEDVRTESGDQPEDLKCWCASCSHFVSCDVPEDGSKCEIERWEKCVNCGGQCPPGEKCPNYELIPDKVKPVDLKLRRNNGI